MIFNPLKFVLNLTDDFFFLFFNSLPSWHFHRLIVSNFLLYLVEITKQREHKATNSLSYFAWNYKYYISFHSITHRPLRRYTILIGHGHSMTYLPLQLHHHHNKFPFAFYFRTHVTLKFCIYLQKNHLTRTRKEKKFAQLLQLSKEMFRSTCALYLVIHLL